MGCPLHGMLRGQIHMPPGHPIMSFETIEIKMAAVSVKRSIADSWQFVVRALKANCWHCNDFYIGKTKRRLRDRKTEHFKTLTSNCHEYVIADHVFLTNHRIKWDHFEIVATGRSDMHCKIKESLLIRDLRPALNENVGSEKLYLYY